MKDFLVLLREPDGRKKIPSKEFQEKHQENWKKWLGEMVNRGILTSGRPLSLAGSVIKNSGKEVTSGPHQNGEEIIGGFLTIRATDLNEAIKEMTGCPVFESDGYIEVREIM